MKTNCHLCNAEILESTAAETDGLCMPCHKEKTGKQRKYKSESDPKFSALVEQFRLLNHSDPEYMAHTEIKYGTPELSTFNFLRELWQMITPKGNPKALRGSGQIIKGYSFGPPPDGDGPFERLQNSNADMDDIIEVTRYAEICVLLQVASLLDTVSMGGPSCADASWGLFEQTDDDTGGRRIDGLHEMILDECFLKSLEPDGQ